MTVADMNNIEFYKNFPSKPSFHILQNNLQCNEKQAVFINSFGNRPERHNKPNSTSKRDNRLQGCNRNVIGPKDKGVSKILHPAGIQIGNVGNGEAQDSPVIPEDDEPDSIRCESNIRPGGNASTISVNRDPNLYEALPSQDLPTGTGDLSNLWFDVDEERYVYEKPSTNLGFELHESFYPPPVKGSSLTLYPGPAQHQVHQRECISAAEPSDKNANSMKPQLKEHNMPSAALSSSQTRHSVVVPRPGTYQKHNSDDEVPHTESSRHLQNGNNEGIMDSRPVKRQKLPLLPMERPTPRDEDSSMPQVCQPDYVAVTQPETDSARPQAGYEYPSNPIDDARKSQSPSIRQSARVDTNIDWEVTDIEGKEVIEGEVHYWVVWQSTLMPRHELGNSRELINKFEERCKAQLKLKNTRGRQVSKLGKRAMTVDGLGENPPKKRRGRPPKQAKRD